MRTSRHGLAAGMVGIMALAAHIGGGTARAQAIAFQPQVMAFPSGVMLDVTPVATADRRYVRIGVGVSFNTLNGFTTYQVPAVVSGGGGFAGMNGPLGGLGGGMGPGFQGQQGGGFRAAGLGQVMAPGEESNRASIDSDPFARALANANGETTHSSELTAPSEAFPQLRSRPGRSRRLRSPRPVARGSAPLSNTAAASRPGRGS